jgi:sugar phosphate isomerase/epimerase
MNEIKIAVASYSFNKMINAGTLNVFGYMDLLKYRYHAGWADIWTQGCLTSFDDGYIKSIRDHMDRLDLKLANLCVDGPFVWADSAEKRAEHRELMLKYLKAAEALGAKSLRIDFGGPASFASEADVRPEDIYTMSDEAFEYIVGAYREYCSIADGFGCKVGPENHWGWDRVPKYLTKVHEAVNHPAYGCLYHFGNFYDSPGEGRAYAAKHAMHTHVPANSVAFAKSEIRGLLKAGYSGAISVEHHSGKYETERVEWQLGTVRAIIAELLAEGLAAPAAPDYMSGIYAAPGGGA